MCKTLSLDIIKVYMFFLNCWNSGTFVLQDGSPTLPPESSVTKTEVDLVDETSSSAKGACKVLVIKLEIFSGQIKNYAMLFDLLPI